MTDLWQSTLAALRWFSGGDAAYHTLWHCMRGDTPWVVATVVLDLAVAAGYVVIAMHWLRNERLLPDSASKRAMSAMKNIFILCGLCGYLFIPIKLFWPAWRLYDLFLALLAFYTWRYAWGAQDLKVVYNELGRTSRLARELEASQAEVRRRAEFLNAISHDLRTPLNGLTLRTNLAEVQLATDDREGLEKSLEEIRTATAGVAEMLDVLLDYARIDRDDRPPARDVVDLAALVSNVLADVAPSVAGRPVTLGSHVPPTLRLITDRIKLRRILSNLVGNAVKFTARGSVSIHAEWRDADLELHVLDTGSGIPGEKLPRIFEEFYQVGNDQRDHRRGFGMGLPIARQLAGRLGGEIQVRSEVGKGSRFTVVLPGTVIGGPGLPKVSTSAEMSRLFPGGVAHQPGPAISPEDAASPALSGAGNSDAGVPEANLSKAGSAALTTPGPEGVALR